MLNARFHEQEARIVSQAGAPGAITIATNMAGRGTDIKLGGNLDMRLKLELGGAARSERAAREAAMPAEVAAAHEVVKAAGGLLVIGTERHESRRIDNQLRGRSGRQGDPGASRFFLSLEDDLMRIFGSERMGGMLQKLGLKPGEAIIHPWINRALEKAQKKVEARNFDTRKNVLKYDDVMNSQRKEVYGQRREFMLAADVSETVADMRAEVIDAAVAARIPAKAFAEQWEAAALAEDCRRLLNLDLPVAAWAAEEGIDEEAIRDRIRGRRRAHGSQGRPVRRRPDALRREIGAAADAGRRLEGAPAGAGPAAPGHLPALLRPARPAQRVQERGVRAVQRHAGRPEAARDATVTGLQLQAEPPQPPPLPAMMWENHPEAVLEAPAFSMASSEPAEVLTLPARDDVVVTDDPATWRNTPRNALCPCGSGKKFKHCHGRMGPAQP